MTGTFVRAADQDDTATVAKFVHALLDELSGGEGPSLEWVTQRAQAVLPKESVSAFIAFIGDEPVGVLTLNECAAIYAGGSFGEISELYVLPEMRSKGVATCLLRKAQSHAGDQGWARIEVGAPAQPEWQRTLTFYLRNGFTEVGPRLRHLIRQ